MKERGLKPQRGQVAVVSVEERIRRIVAENQSILSREQAEGRRHFPTIRPELDRQRRRTITVR